MNLPRLRVSGAVLRRWLTPGIGIKRWLVVVFAGELLLALAGALILRELYRDFDFGPGETVLYLMTLQFLPYWVRGVVVGVAGVGLFVWGSWRAVRGLMGPFLASESDQPLVEVIYQKRFLSRGPKTVVIGGGTGLSTLLRGIKEHTSNITAVVTVADDGGSSGRLREERGIPAVGDIRNCIAALADSEPLMAELLQYRFTGGADAGLSGHTVGNLLLAAMASVQGDDFEELHAQLIGGTQVSGQSEIARSTRIDRVWLMPDNVAASEDARRAIEEADLVVIGPGSLYTSIMPSLLLPDLLRAVKASAAVKLYICNVATQRGESQGYDLADHLAAIERHTGAGWIDVVLANNRFDAKRPGSYGAEPVKLRWPPSAVFAHAATPRLVLEDVVDPENAHHHDPARLAGAVMRVYERESYGRRRSRVPRTA